MDTDNTPKPEAEEAAQPIEGENQGDQPDTNTGEPSNQPAELSESPLGEGSAVAVSQLSDSPSNGRPWYRKVVPWIIAVLVSLAAGFLLGFFLLYQPAAGELRSANNQLATAQEQISSLENSLEDANSDLTTAQADLTRTQQQLERVEFNQALAEVQANVTYARLALATKDLLTARQELSAAELNLVELNKLLADQDTASALTERIQLIRASLVSDSVKALEELRLLSENLARIEPR